MPGTESVTITWSSLARRTAVALGAMSERTWVGKKVNVRTKADRIGRSHWFRVLMRDLRNTFPVWGQHSPGALWK